ncbi:hypothetical protein GQ55_9G110800 [Panicum hallii var. hallii]|uniref:Uncharacterized protein n=1 Tax=Panicum hallii var. hallii TaxID=1504633 RepID=A0A2T7C1V6_9POAL|nr:hypothetical protein GQ55_9G110800 [Panicum hallii var. hallii]
MTTSPAVCAVLPLLLAACFLFPAADGSRPSISSPHPEELREPAVAYYADLRDDEPHLHQHQGVGETGTTRPAGVEVEGAAEGRAAAGEDDDGGAAPSGTASARGGDQGGGAGSRHWTAWSPTSPVPLRFRTKLARRVLAGAPGERAADSVARPSCRSSNVHVGCPPALHN